MGRWTSGPLLHCTAHGHCWCRGDRRRRGGAFRPFSGGRALDDIDPRGRGDVNGPDSRPLTHPGGLVEGWPRLACRFNVPGVAVREVPRTAARLNLVLRQRLLPRETADIAHQPIGTCHKNAILPAPRCRPRHPGSPQHTTGPDSSQAPGWPSPVDNAPGTRERRDRRQRAAWESLLFLTIDPSS